MSGRILSICNHLSLLPATADCAGYCSYKYKHSSCASTAFHCRTGGVPPDSVSCMLDVLVVCIKQALLQRPAEPLVTDSCVGCHVQAEQGSSKMGMPCTSCLHPTCKHSPAQQGVLACPECAVGLLVLDPVSAPKWRLDCSRCSFLIYLPKELHDAKVAKDRCEVSNLEAVEGVVLLLRCNRYVCWVACEQSCFSTAVVTTCRPLWCASKSVWSSCMLHSVF
jgi:hypothetical protein